MAIKIPQSVNNLLSKEMDRKDFLKNLGVASLFVAGAGMFVKSVNPLGVNGGSAAKSSVAQKNSAAYGYGASSYGG